MTQSRRTRDELWRGLLARGAMMPSTGTLSWPLTIVTIVFALYLFTRF